MCILVFHIPLIFAEVKIPVIVVFTKYDLLVLGHYRACSHISFLPDKRVGQIGHSGTTKELEIPFYSCFNAEESAEREWRSVNYIYNQSVPFKLTATAGTILVELIKVTQENLRVVEGSFRVVWIAAQEINAREKVKISIRCVFPR